MFTAPEIATVGWQQKAIDAGEIPAETVRLDLAGNPRAKMQGVHDGFVKLFCRPGTGIIVGGVVVGPRASELVHPISIAVAESLTVDQMAHAFTVYPSMSGSIAEAARRLHHGPLKSQECNSIRHSRDISKPGKSNIQRAFCASSLISHWSLGSHRCHAPHGSSRPRPPGWHCSPRSSSSPPPGAGVPDGLGGLHGPGERQARPDRARLRARPRDVAVRRPGSRPQGADLPADPGLLLPGHGARQRDRFDPGADHRPTPTTTCGCCRPAGSPYARRAVRRRTPSRRTSARPPGGWWPRAPTPWCSTPTAAGTNWKTLAGDAEFFGPASLTLRVAGTTRAYRGALRLQQQQHRQRARPRRLRAGRDPARDADLVAARGRARPGRRGPDLRRLRPQRPPDPLLRHLRHHVLPGLRRHR